MRNLSFALTTAQMRAKTKTVTRRRGVFWSRVLKPGDLVCAVEKSQGIKRGGLVRLGVIRVVSVKVEALWEALNYGRSGAFPVVSIADPDYDAGRGEAAREGFAPLTASQFIDVFIEHMGGTPGQLVTRIEFEHVGCSCHHAAIEHGPPSIGCHFCPCQFTRAVPL